MHRRELFFATFGAVLTASCGDSSPKPTDDIRQRLVGKWRWELQEDGVSTRSIVTLDQDGKFRELEEIFETNGPMKQVTHTGEWFFDGINFKRKYTHLNGQPLSNAQFAYATYAIKSSTKNEFAGVDNVRRTVVHFSRVEAGTQP